MKLALPLLFFVATLIMRLPVLLAHLDTWYPFEVHAGTIATAVLDGVDMDVPNLPIAAHIRGNIVNAALLVPLYACFGVSSITMKLVPWAWHALTIALLVYVLQRFVSRRAAVLTGLLLLVGQPAFDKLSVLGLSSHMESTLIMTLALWPCLAMVSDRRFTVGRCVCFGAVVGFAGFYHLQALLPCLLLVGLMVVAELPAFGVKGALTALLAGGLLAGPAFLFHGGNVRLLTASVDAGAAEVADPALAPKPPLQKVVGLFTGDFAGALEFTEIGGLLGRVLAAAMSLGLLLLVAFEFWRDRGRVGAVLARVFRRRQTDWLSPSLFFGLHALAMVAMFAVSHTTTKEALSAGASNRHLAPLWFSMFVVAGIGASGLIDRGSKRLAATLLALVLVPGVLGAAAVMRSDPANRIPQRGECYEWFRAHLVHAVGGRDGGELVDLMERVDRGDPLFRPLRYRMRLSLTPTSDPAMLQKEAKRREPMRSLLQLYALSDMGRKLAGELTRPPRQRPDWLRRDLLWRYIDAQPKVTAAAILHGIGLGCEPPRSKGQARLVEGFLENFQKLLAGIPEHHAKTIAEGYGFGIGFVHDPYSWQRADLIRMQSSLGEMLQPSIFRGIAWGYRQRYLEPPSEVPEGLTILEYVPDAARRTFEAAFTGEVLPPEAEALKGVYEARGG